MTIDVARSVKKMFVDGQWVESESGQLFDADSPATGEIIAQVGPATRILRVPQAQRPPRNSNRKRNLHYEQNETSL